MVRTQARLIRKVDRRRDVAHGSASLGFVHAGRQRFGFAAGAPIVLSAYRAFAAADRDALAELSRLIEATGPPDARAWRELIGTDLEQAYGPRAWRHVARVHATSHGHRAGGSTRQAQGAARREGAHSEPLTHILDSLGGRKACGLRRT
jgi:hypothetical protein